jgi:hypothetical protein
MSRRFVASWLVLVACLVVHSCSALDPPRSYLRRNDETSAYSAVHIQGGQLLETDIFETQTQEEVIAAKMVPQIIESVGTAMTAIVSSPDATVATSSTWSKDTNRRHHHRALRSLLRDDRQLQGTLVEDILGEIIVIVITAVAEILVAVIAGALATTLSDPIAGLLEEIIGGIIVAIAGFIAAAIVDALFGGGTQLRAFVTNTFGQSTTTTTAVAKPKFLQWFRLRKRVSAPAWLTNTMNRLNTTKLTKTIASKLKLPTAKSVVGASFLQVFRTTMDNFDMAGLQQEIASTLPSTSSSSFNMTMDTSAVNATELGETMLAILDVMAKK